ncbi:MAG: RecQ family zinc-binding domain-containing protein [Bacteroidales bacterium]|nr:RecQ family zinc-binding domain-containing protein [Bacteroidales bacterium]
MEAVINYAFNDNVCRERQLLTYFGESVDNDCGH